MTESASLAITSQQQSPAALAFLHDGAALDHRYRLAKAFSMSDLVQEPIDLPAWNRD